jgi:hypothetical protein
MQNMNNILPWIQHWYASQCNGHWEHGYGITIKTLDNPGWNIAIDLSETSLEGTEIEYESIEQSETDWYAVYIKDSIFSAHGDPTKLEFLLNKFKELAEANQ